jgi:hypothetical protein
MPEKPLPLWIFSFGLFPLGLGGFALGGADIATGFQSRAWNEVPGIVLSARLEKSMFAPRQPEIRYGYSVGDSRYVSNRIWPGKTFAYMPELSLGASERLLSQFPKGSTVPVYVNPKNLLDVALVRGPRKAMTWMGIFTFFLSLGFWSPLALGLLLEKKLNKP